MEQSPRIPRPACVCFSFSSTLAPQISWHRISGMLIFSSQAFCPSFCDCLLPSRLCLSTLGEGDGVIQPTGRRHQEHKCSACMRAGLGLAGGIGRVGGGMGCPGARAGARKRKRECKRAGMISTASWLAPDPDVCWLRVGTAARQSGPPSLPPRALHPAFNRPIRLENSQKQARHGQPRTSPGPAQPSARGCCGWCRDPTTVTPWPWLWVPLALAQPPLQRCQSVADMDGLGRGEASDQAAANPPTISSSSSRCRPAIDPTARHPSVSPFIHPFIHPLAFSIANKLTNHVPQRGAQRRPCGPCSG